MRRIIEVVVCDVCGKTVESDGLRRRVVIGTGNWERDDFTTSVDRDLCKECYSTILSLIEPSGAREQKAPEVKNKRGGMTAKIDRETVLNLRRGGMTPGSIADQMGCTDSAIYRILRENGMGTGYPHRKKIYPTEDKAKQNITTVIDETGCVLSTKFS